MNEILKMIVDDDKLFKVKTDETVDPLTLDKITRQKREELRNKIDKHSKENVDKMREEIVKEFSDYRSQVKDDIEQKINNAADNFNQKLDSNLHRFDKEVKQALEDINKPMDLLDTSYVKDGMRQNLQKIFDLKDYMKSDNEILQSEKNLEEKLNTKETYSAFDLRNFETTSESPLSQNNGNKKTKKERILSQFRNLFSNVKAKMKCFADLNKEAFRCFKHK